MDGRGRFYRQGAEGVVTTIRRTAPHGAEPVQRRLRPQPLQRTPVPFAFPSEASPDGNTKVVFEILAEGSPPVAARPMRWPPRARSWLSSSAGPRARHAADDPGLAGLGRGATPAEGRAESVPEAGGTGADAAATPTTPPPVTTQTHAKSMASTGGDRGSAGEHPATGRMERSARRKPGELPNRARCRSGDDLPGVRGGSAPRQPPQGTHGVWPQGVTWLDALSLRQASLGARGSTMRPSTFSRSTARCSANDPPVRLAKHRRGRPHPRSGVTAPPPRTLTRRWGVPGNTQRAGEGLLPLRSPKATAR